MKNYSNMKENINYSQLKDAANTINNGGIVIFPTETVYGIGGNAFDENAVKKIFIAKGRSFNNPINVLVNSIKMVENIAIDITPLEYKLMKSYFPGPFTLILHKNPVVPDIVTAGLDFIGVRSPDSEIAKLLIEYSGVPIAAPSANISGKTSGTCFDDIYTDFKDKVDYMIDNGNSFIGIESTIVKVIDEIPHILRPGSITAEQIENISNTKVIKDYNSSFSNLPSENFKHYSLNTKSVLIYSNNNDTLVSKILEIATNYRNPTILSSSANINKYKNYEVIDLGNNANDIAKELFGNLKKADNIKSDIIIIEGISPTGIGEAIMNRLIKSCNNNFLYI